MRRVVRHELSARSARALDREQIKADTKRATGMLRVEAEWNRARRNKPLAEAATVLRAMAGNRERCMYCGDSHGTDIEHFWPKTPYPEHMFRWTNMLLCCAECGRIKGTQFPLSPTCTPATRLCGRHVSSPTGKPELCQAHRSARR